MNYRLVAFLLLIATHITMMATDSSEEVDSKPKNKDSSQLLRLTKNDMTMFLNGRLKDDFFFYNNVRTFRNDYGDQNNFVRHRLDLNLHIEQGTKRYGKPASEAGVRLTNYIYWQQYGHYLPFSKEDIRSTDLDSTIVARDVTVKTLMPLIFVEQAWFKLNFDTFNRSFENHPSFLQVGFFKYFVGRGISLGYHDDLAVDYLGWPGEGHYTRYSQMPPGILFRTTLNKNWSADLYWMKWTSVSSDLEDTLAPTRAQRLDVGPERGVNKDRSNYVLKFDYQPKEDTAIGKLHLQSYLVHTRAPEQSIEFEADASAYLTTLGTMVDCTHGNCNVNVEVAGQFGHQDVYAIDRNTKVLGANGAVFSHIFMDENLSNQRTSVGASGTTKVIEREKFIPKNNLEYLINLPQTRTFSQQGQQIDKAKAPGVPGVKDIFNANTFGNPRFRPGYRLNYQSFMALADVSYTLDEWPYKITTAAGYIGGDTYPYNEETSRTFRGFIPMRSRYTGYSMENFLVFNRLVINRPLNISNRTMWAYNNLKDLSNLQFLGVGLIWYPCDDRKKCSCTTNIWGLWEVAHLKKWDRYGHHPDSKVETQIALERARLGFPGVPRTYEEARQETKIGNSGWISDKDASRMLGVEIDMRADYVFLDHAKGFALLSLFMPGALYKDLEGQPNFCTRRVDNQGFSHYDSLGSEPAFAIVIGLNYKF
jgi:hypothetical protein